MFICHILIDEQKNGDTAIKKRKRPDREAYNNNAGDNITHPYSNGLR